ncbi:MAG: HigA family addiction module antitoxin [Candidatus Eremiobacteraeota bacterium]|nr:HigA family addiction module antitoxin [Candidatus Eremiobacteraeota bacterium]
MSEILVPSHRRPTTPGAMIREMYLGDDGLGITQSVLASRLGITRQRLNEILNDRRALTVDTALRLERVLGPSVGFWMNLQMSVEIYDAMHGAAAKRIAKLKPLRAA